MSISPRDFDFIKELVYAHTGNLLEGGKEYLVETRLMPVARELGFEGISQLVDALRTKGRAGSGVGDRVLDAMMIAETSFFRDIHPFEALRQKIFPDLIERRQTERRLRIWCAAASSGQEPYSLAMLLDGLRDRIGDWQIDFTATDISATVLERARQGIYTQFEVNRGVPADKLVRYFQRQGLQWQISPAIRNMVNFRQLNLLTPWPDLPQMDLIMIRNVLIYFDQPAKKMILKNLAKQMRADGYLLVGGTESVIMLVDDFEAVHFDRTIVYKRQTPGSRK